jgi:spore maturation protein B
LGFLLFLSEAILPLLVFFIVAHGVAQKQTIYDDFIQGAKEGFSTVIGIMPTLIGLMVAVGILRASGFLDFLSAILGSFMSRLSFPKELVPLTIVKLFSSSAATGLLLDIYKEYGADSYLGTLASLMMSSTETIFYTLSVYFMAAKVTKSRYSLAGALFATFAGIVASVTLAKFL